MPGTTIGANLNLGFLGNVSRSNDTVIETYVASGAIAFGDPVVLNSNGTVSKFGASNTAADFIGIAVREIKQADDVTGGTKYNDKQPVDVIVRGSVAVRCVSGTPAAKGTPYIQVVAETGVAAIGDFTATASSTAANSVALTNAVWSTGKKDANKTVELTILTRHI